MTSPGYYDQSYPPSVLRGGGAGADPHINALLPSSVAASAVAIAVTVTGSKFVAGSVVEANQSPLATNYVSATELVATYDPAEPGTVEFTVRNPNEEESNSVLFTVLDAATRRRARSAEPAANEASETSGATE